MREYVRLVRDAKTNAATVRETFAARWEITTRHVAYIELRPSLFLFLFALRLSYRVLFHDLPLVLSGVLPSILRNPQRSPR